MKMGTLGRDTFRGVVPAMVLCRYTVYLFLLGMAAAHGLLSDNHLNPWLVYFVAVPVLFHGVLVFGFEAQRWRFDTLQWLHLLEFLITYAVLLDLRVGGMFTLAVAWIFFASNTALWGLAQGLLQISAAGLMWGVWCGGCVLSSIPVLDRVALAGSYCFMLTVCVVAHRQARSLLAARRSAHTTMRQLLRYLPDDMARWVQSPGAVGLRRIWVTVAFVDLVGFTQAARELPEDILHARLNRFLSVAALLTRQWGGFVSKFLGDGVLCVFPSNSAGERKNNAVQCVRCIMIMACELRDQPDPTHAEGAALLITAGISSGYCTSGSWGSGSRWDYTVIGTPINLASRLQSMLNTPGVLLDEATAELVNSHVSLGKCQTVNVKSFDQQKVFPVSPGGEEPVGCTAGLC